VARNNAGEADGRSVCFEDALFAGAEGQAAARAGASEYGDEGYRGDKPTKESFSVVAHLLDAGLQ
jgi:hypothetical protein